MAKFAALLWPIFTAYVWTVCCADILDCVLIYVYICLLHILTWMDVNYMRLI